MISLSLNLPTKRRLHVEIVKRRNSAIAQPLLPDIRNIIHTRKGSKFSRYFRHIFEHKNIRKIFGANIALLLAASTIYPAQTNFQTSPDNTVVSQDVAVLTTQKGTRYPVALVKITQGYKIYHPAIDFDGLTGDAIFPIMAGRVEAVSYSRYAYGNAILINHGNSVTSLYAHLSKILVQTGQEVDSTTQIGKMGATGRSSGDHLHLEIRDHGIPFNPLLVLPR